MAESNKDKENKKEDVAKDLQQSTNDAKAQGNVKNEAVNQESKGASLPEQKKNTSQKGFVDLGWGAVGSALVKMLIEAGDDKAKDFVLGLMNSNLRKKVEEWIKAGRDLKEGPFFSRDVSKEQDAQNDEVGLLKDDAKDLKASSQGDKGAGTPDSINSGNDGGSSNDGNDDDDDFEFLNKDMGSMGEDSDFFAEFNSANWPKQLMVLPVFGRPLLPSQIIPLQVSNKWHRTIEKTLNTQEKLIAIFSLPLERENAELNPEDFENVFTVARIIQCRSGEDIQFVVQALGRAKLEFNIPTHGVILCKAQYLEAKMPKLSSKEGLEIRALSMSVIQVLKELVGCNPMYFEELKQYVGRFDPNNPSLLADCAAAVTNSSFTELNEILNTIDLLPRLELCLKVVNNELNVARIQTQIKERVGQSINEKQREAILREQLREIKNELGMGDNLDSFSDVSKFKERMENLNPPKEVAERFDNEIKRMQNIDVSSAEYGVARDYLECLTTVPWGVYVGADADIKDAKAVLEKDHEGLKEVKECIIESLAVSVFNKNEAEAKRGIGLLFVGPPGVGKTSIGRSVARALKRPFFRVSLGGISDESEIRGHRRTYIGAYAGKLVQALRTTKAMNPVIMLDEVDKLRTSATGDPAAALLEVLDPEQNNSFTDHYLDVPLDLSGCFFICTANSVESIPAPLRDRMEVISLNGYLTDEKFRIAKKYLLPKIIKQSGVTSRQIKMSDPVIKRVIEGYAREAGVRNLERQLKRIVRKCVVKLMTTDDLKMVNVKQNELVSYLGVAPFDNEFLLQGIGIATGLAWNSVGGCALPIEAEIISRTTKNGGISVTGNLGKVMKESVEIALSYIRASLNDLAPEVFASDPKILDEALVHVHVPEGAVEKDGPSAGITIASALLSMVTKKAPREGFAMTGEISLTGRVLAIGGLEEKVMGARRMGIHNLIVPLFNKSNVDNMSPEIKAGVNFYYVERYPEVARILFGEREVAPSYTAPLINKEETKEKVAEKKNTVAKKDDAKKVKLPKRSISTTAAPKKRTSKTNTIGSNSEE